MRSKRTCIGGMVAVVAMALTMAACERGPQAVDAQEPTVNLSATDSTIMAGETTTIMAQTANLLGREVDISWDTSLGEIEPTEQGRMARFSSNDAGTAVVTAEVSVDGRVIRDRINITVNPVE